MAKELNRSLPKTVRAKLNTEIIREVATKHNWQETDDTNGGIMLTFIRDDKKIEVWPSTMTVATMLKHPKQGKTKLYRRKIWELKTLEAIFENPRVHTTGGYKQGRKKGHILDTELSKGGKK